MRPLCLLMTTVDFHILTHLHSLYKPHGLIARHTSRVLLGFAASVSDIILVTSVRPGYWFLVLL